MYIVALLNLIVDKRLSQISMSKKNPYLPNKTRRFTTFKNFGVQVRSREWRGREEEESDKKN